MKSKYLNNFILILLGIFFITEHHFKFTAIKNISLYLALFLSLCLFFTDRKSMISNFKINFYTNRFPLIAIIAFCLYTILLSFFPYDRSYDSALEAFGEFRRGIAFLLIILFWFDGSQKKINFMFYCAIFAFFFVSIFYARPLITSFANIDSSSFEAGRIINRAYADYVDMFLAFGLVGVLLTKQKIFKILIAIFCIILPLFMDILAGARGSYLANAFCITLFVIFSYKYGYKGIYKENAKWVLLILLSGAILVSTMAHDSSILKYKLSQGSNSSGRDLILKERLPLLFKSSRAFIGLGYGKEQYDAFLRDENDRGISISMMQIDSKSQRFWWNDEPFFIGKYYYYGIFGTLMLVFIFIWILWAAFVKFKNTKNLIYLAIFISTFSYFGIRGLFESINLRILYMFYMVGFMVMLNSSYKRRNSENFTH